MRLTREERAKVVRELRERIAPLEPSWTQETDALCRAQLRKAMKYLERRGTLIYYIQGNEFRIDIPEAKWKQLRKEAGLE